VSKKRSPIGNNPLDAILPGDATAATQASRRGLEPAGTTPRPKPEPRRTVPKVRATFHIPGELLEECRDAVVHLSGPPVRLTLAQLAEEALRRELARLKKKYNGGEDFPPRSGELRGGRPVK